MTARRTRRQGRRRRYLADLGERAGRTFAATLLPLVFTPMHWWAGWDVTGNPSKIGLAGAATLATVGISLAASQVGAPDSASLLPASVDPPQE